LLEPVFFLQIRAFKVSEIAGFQNF